MDQHLLSMVKQLRDRNYDVAIKNVFDGFYHLYIGRKFAAFLTPYGMAAVLNRYMSDELDILGQNYLIHMGLPLELPLLNKKSRY